MKSLSDYAKILRSIATNLNLHGESVEMIVQMLANALYISEVEHITYSQEASLERASLINSKIQHCVNQMYSVYRGSNPRVIINFKSTKLFQFNPYDEIIKSNNFKVYYLGYLDSSTGEMVYSSSTIYPDSDATIIGLIASEIYNTSWTISDNLYYRSFPESDFSNDLYLRDVTNDTYVDVTRFFPDHLRENKFFDLTLPGYGCRLYYPESYLGFGRDNLVNLKLELNVYKYFTLSSIVESEKKALKMDGSILQSFSDKVLLSLKSKEDYPGIIYIPETTRDGINTIHHKANKSRYSGTYLSTNSDLSFLLQEYYPSKIKTNGVTYRFDTPKSTTIETITKKYSLSDTFGGISYTDIKSLLSGWTNNQGYLPSGKLSFKYSKGGSSTETTNTSYDLICTSSILPATISGGIINPGIESIGVKVLKNNEGKTELLTTGGSIWNEGLLVVYKYSNGRYTVLRSLGELEIPAVFQNSNNYRLEINLIKSSDLPTISNTLPASYELAPIDREILPAVYTPVSDTITETQSKLSDGVETVIKTETTNTVLGNYYGINLKDDTLYVQTDFEGNLLSTNNKTEVSFYHNGEKVSNGDCKYSIIPVSDLIAEIDEKTGVLSITGMSQSKNVAYLTVMADYKGNVMTETLTVKKSISNFSDSDKPGVLYIYADEDPNPLYSLIVTSEEKDFVLDIPDNTWKSIRVVREGSNINTTSGIYTFRYTVLNNVLESGTVVTPSLYLYYIPYASSNLLSTSEKERFVLNHKSYFVTQDIFIEEGKEFTARFNINLELYNNSSLDETILGILEDYSYKFGLDLGDSSHSTPLQEEIKSLINKVSDVKYVSKIEIKYYDPTGKELDYETQVLPYLDISYFEIECNILSIVSSN